MSEKKISRSDLIFCDECFVINNITYKYSDFIEHSKKLHNKACGYYFGVPEFDYVDEGTDDLVDDLLELTLDALEKIEELRKHQEELSKEANNKKTERIFCY